MTHNQHLYNALYIIANEPLELSHDKIQEQIRFFRSVAKDALEGYHTEKVIDVRMKLEEFTQQERDQIFAKILELNAEENEVGKLNDDF